MKKLYILSALMLVLASGLFVSCETPDNSQAKEAKKEMGDAEGNTPIKPRPPVIPPTDPKK